MKSNTIKKNNGITLIALIITIIVMLILVSVTISMAVNGGLFDYAGRAARETKNAVNAENELAKGRIQVGGVWYDSIGDYLEKKPSSNQGETDEEDEINAVGVVDNENTITLASNLPNDTYTLKYENNNGPLANYKEICTLTATADSGTRVYDDFITENCAPVEATIIGVYNSQNQRVGDIALGHLGTNLGNKLYSFGAISDVHLQTDGSKEEFQEALTYFNNSNTVDFIAICGDLTNNGSEEELTEYKSYVETYSPYIPVYAISGNHENSLGFGNYETFEPYTGYPLYYTFTRENDMFIMVGNCGGSEEKLFSTEELQWLYETLEANRDKRCFVFQHVRADSTSGNAGNIYTNDIWGGTEATIYESFMSHYTNTTWFHGHSHLQFYLQYLQDNANYDNSYGNHSVHIPSITVPRGGTSNGEGYIVDVYESGISLKGRDFSDDKFLPIAQYYLDTTIKNIEENTYIDSTGTIDTTGENSYINQLPIATGDDENIYNDIGYKANTRWSSSSNAEAELGGIYLSGYIPVKAGDTVYLKNVVMDKNNDRSIVFWFESGKGTMTNSSNVELLSREDHGNGIWDDNNNLIQFRAVVSGYMRIQCQGFDESSIVSINKAIE